MKLAGAFPKQHGEIIGRERCRLLEVNDTDDLLELPVGALDVNWVFVSSKSAKNPSSLFQSTDFDEPPGRLGEECYYGKEDEEGNYLNGDGQPPTDWRCSRVNERKATGDTMSATVKKASARQKQKLLFLTIQASMRRRHRRRSM